MLRRGSHLAIACLVIGVAARPASADADLGAITSALDNSDYPAAQDLIAKGLALGGNSPDSTVELYRLQGVVEGSLGNTQRATDAFLRALALKPKLALAAGTSPKVMKPFEAAKNFYKTNEPLKVKVDTRATPPAVTLVVQSDPLKMVARARVAFVVDGKPEQMRDGTGTIELPAGARIDLRVTALDASGNRLVEIGSSDVPIVIVSSARSTAKPQKVAPKKQPDGPVHERPLYAKWWLWGGAAVAFAGLGVGFSVAALDAKGELEALNATSTAHSFDEAMAKEDTIRTRLLVSNISYGVAIGCGVTAAILFLTKPSAERSTISIAPAPTRGGGAIVLGGEF
jgi:hypothetical protein